MPRQRFRLFQIIATPFRAGANGIKRFYLFFSEKQEDRPIGETFTNVVNDPQTLLPHLNELRKRLFRVVLYLLAGGGIAFTFVTPIMNFLALPLPGGMESLQAVDITEPVIAVWRVALLAGFAMVFPLIAFEIWGFFAEGLNGQERLISLIAIPVATAFFLAGMAFAYYFLLPTALPILLNYMGLKSIPRPNSYFPFIINLLFWMGISFEFPLVVSILARFRLIRASDLARQWRIAVVLIAIIAAAITTTTDPANMALVMLPMTVLYFVSIGLAYLAQPRQALPAKTENQ